MEKEQDLKDSDSTLSSIITDDNKHERVQKYAHALSLYSNTKLTIKEICQQTQISFVAFSSYLSHNHRDLILKRHNLEGLKNVKLRGTKGQTTAAHLKYQDAIAAADNLEYIEFNISQIARIFGLDPSGLGNQLRYHYPDIVPRREKERQRLGIADNTPRGVRPWCRDAFAEAVEMLRTTDMTVKEVSDACMVNFKGLMNHLLAYHKDIVAEREKKRKKAVTEKVRGGRTGAWTIHNPTEATTKKYAEALELYRTSSLSVEEIAHRFGLGLGAFRYHLRNWNTELMVERRGFDRDSNIAQTKRYKKATIEKYAAAIERLKNSDLSISAVAREFDLHSEVFRSYLREHEPEIVSRLGMKTLKDGKRVSLQSSEKYAEAIRLYETTSESLKSIAERLGLVYISLGNYVRRNHPELIERHKALSVSLEERFAAGIEMLHTSDKTIGAVMKELGYNEYFRIYIKGHHPELLNRTTIRQNCTNMPVKIQKYAEAVRLLETTSLPMAEIAKRLGMNYHSMQRYMYAHHRDLMERRRKKQ